MNEIEEAMASAIKQVTRKYRKEKEAKKKELIEAARWLTDVLACVNEKFPPQAYFLSKHVIILFGGYDLDGDRTEPWIDCYSNDTIIQLFRQWKDDPEGYGSQCPKYPSEVWQEWIDARDEALASAHLVDLASLRDDEIPGTVVELERAIDF